MLTTAGATRSIIGAKLGTGCAASGPAVSAANKLQELRIRIVM
jgi:hypothetical protein